MSTASASRAARVVRTAAALAATLAVAPLLVPLLARAGEEPLRVFPGGVPDGRLEKAVTLDGEHPWTPPATLDLWKERAERTRRQILVAAGLWPPPPRTPLAPVVHGRIERGEYSVEKVRFESFPGFHVTGNLYRPLGREGRLPAVLSPHGHWANGRFYERSSDDARKEIDQGAEKFLPNARYPLQARCAHLARMGCVVFHYDMVGYADSKQLAHTAGFGDLDAELHLQSAFGLQTWNTLRAFDFLTGLPDVDPKRIGVTGASGGGTQTFILCAIDGRPAAAFPAVMVSTDMQGGCICENASHLRVGTNNVEFAALAAPRPYALTGANDWTRHILERGYPELKAVYRLHGAEDRIAAWCYPEFDHNYNQVAREHMYAWFGEHLALGAEAPREERAFEPIPPAELSVFDAEHPRPGGAASIGELRAWWRGATDAQLAALYPQDAASLARFREVVGGALEVMLHTTLPDPAAVELKEHGTGRLGEHELRKLALGRRGASEAVPALLYMPAKWGGNIVVGLAPHGKPLADDAGARERFEGAFSQARDEGLALLIPDVYLTGEYGAGAAEPAGAASAAARLGKDAGRHGAYVGYTYGYNRTLLAERVHDVLTAIGAARGMPGVRKVHLWGADDAAVWAVLASALSGDAVDKLVLTAERLPSFREADSFDHPLFVPGALRYGDIPAFLALSAPRWLLYQLADPVPAIVRDAYRASGHDDRAIDALQRWPELARSLTAWLAE
jgi:hypothetical protein